MSEQDDVLAHYEAYPEEDRLAQYAGRLERDRTKEILQRVLPKPPARIIDVGGAAGVYSIWLAELGYETHLVDLTPRLVEEARKRSATLEKPIASMTVADARKLPQPDAFADAVMVMGPMYHLTTAADRHDALREAHRVLRTSGLLAVAGISRYASAMDGLARNLIADPAFRALRDQDLRDGQHRNTPGRLDYFTTAYFHRPEDLQREIETAGFSDARVLGVEGPAWTLADFDARWADSVLRADIMSVARALESEPSIVGASAHLLGIATKV